MRDPIPVITDRVSEEDCLKIGGHCYRRLKTTLDSNPPRYPEMCLHCRKERVAIPREAFEYYYPEEW